MTLDSLNFSSKLIHAGLNFNNITMAQNEEKRIYLALNNLDHLFFYHQTGDSTWDKEVLTAETSIGNIDLYMNENNPYIIYYILENQSLNMSYRKDGQWNKSRIAENVSQLQNSFVFDSQGNPRICYLNEIDKCMKPTLKFEFKYIIQNKNIK